MIIFDENGKPKLEVQIEERLIILPGDPEYYVAKFSPDWRQVADKTNGEFCIIGRHNLAVPVSWAETTEYIYGGEYDLEMGRQNVDRDSSPTIRKWKNPI